jgi:ribosome-associated protein
MDGRCRILSPTHDLGPHVSIGDLTITPGPGVPSGLVIPAAELDERFSRSSGPGGQSVNTTDSRVELGFDIVASAALTDLQRQRLLTRLAHRLSSGVLVIAASAERSQLRNRADARTRMSEIIRESLAPPPPQRRARRPSAAARQRRYDAKIHRSTVKARRRRPDLE